MKNTKTKLIIFDFYGVIIKGTYRDTARWLSKHYGLSSDHVLDVLYFKYFNQAAEGKITEPQMFSRAMRELGIPLSWQEIRKKHLSFLKLNRPIFTEAIRLQLSGHRVLFLSKNTPSQFKELLKKYSIKKSIRHVINTYDLGLPKASPQTIRFVLRRFKVQSKDVIMIDDQAFNLVEPKKLGVRTVLYQNNAQLKKELEKFTRRHVY